MILLPALTFDFGTVNRIVDGICKFVDNGRSCADQRAVAPVNAH